jgi:hypothetical protein
MLIYNFQVFSIEVRFQKFQVIKWNSNVVSQTASENEQLYTFRYDNSRRMFRILGKSLDSRIIYSFLDKEWTKLGV